MSKVDVQQPAPKRSAAFDAALDLEEALTKAEAIAQMACGEGGAVLRRMSDDIQDSYMWALLGLVRQAKAASEAMGQHTAACSNIPGGSNA